MEHELFTQSQIDIAERRLLETQKNAAENGRLIVLILAAANLVAGAWPIFALCALFPLAAAYFADVASIRGSSWHSAAWSAVVLPATVALSLLTLLNVW
jgi:ABC-type multidrug transport system permease subunit